MNARTKQRENAARLLIEYPLTQGQAALWFHYKLAPNSAAYNMAGVVAVQSNTVLASRGVGGTWSKEIFITAVRTMKGKGMPWAALKPLEDSDLEAILLCLQSLSSK